MHIYKLILILETLRKYIDRNKIGMQQNIIQICIKNKEDNKRLNKNMNNCVYFRNNLYCDANFAATNFV
jgi:hypothetical protein